MVELERPDLRLGRLRLSEARDEIVRYYRAFREEDRLSSDTGPLERERSREILSRYLPPAPARILDIGGGAGDYASWLGSRGYETHLVDPVPEHVEQARARSRLDGDTISSFAVGDARDLRFADDSADGVLLMGPLYHLPDADDRRTALREAFRVLQPGGRLCAAVISRYASLLDGLRRDILSDPEYLAIVRRDLTTGVHKNTTGRIEYFTTAYFHDPDEVRAELVAAGFTTDAVLGIEGPGWILTDLTTRWSDHARREALLLTARELESVPSALAMSGHLMAVATKPEPETG